MNVKHIEVLTNMNGTDKVNLYLDAETTYPNMGYDPCAVVDTAKGYGAEWVRKTFPGRLFKFVDCKTGTTYEIGRLVRMTEEYKKKLMENDCKDHVDEFGGLVGVVLRPVKYKGDVIGPEVYVRWDLGEFGVVYPYSQEDLVDVSPNDPSKA